MKKKVLVLLLALVFMLVFFGCGSAEPAGLQAAVPVNSSQLARSNPTGNRWTILVYLCGTDLETNGAYASVNIAEMTEAVSSEQVNVVFQTGGTEKWAIDAISSEELQRWQVLDGDIQLADSQPLANMGDAETLGAFLKWGVERYPADKYMCLLWDHGGGSVAGIAVDELHGYDTLDLRELSQGVSMAGVQFELVGFDACLMSTMETAAVLAPTARYMVASQELEPGTGWDYAAWLSELANNPAATGLEVGKSICDTFYAKCVQNGTDSLATLAVTDLSKIPGLVQSFDAMAAELKGIIAFPEKLQPLTQAMVRAENYGGNNQSEGYTNMVDLGDLTLCAEGVLAETGQAVRDSLSQAVVYNIAGAGRQKSNGLSVYVPLAIAEGELDRYATLAATSGDYLRFFEGLYDWQVPAGVVINQPTLPAPQQLPQTQPAEMASFAPAEFLDRNSFTLRYSTTLTEDGYVLLTVDEGAEMIRTVAYNLFYLEEESGSLWYLGADFDVNASDDGTQYWDNFRNVWTIINDNLCMMMALSFTEDYILYTVPVTVNGSETNLRMLYHRDSAEYEVLGTWDGIDSETGMSSRDVKKLTDGDVVTLMFSAADLDSGEAYTFEGGSFTVNGFVVAEEATLFDGVYYYQYEVTDIFGTVYESDFAVLTSLHGEITVEME